jgi:hypothetical protein
MIVKETETAQNSWFAVEDINRRAEAAYKQHIDLFEDQTHKARVAAVVEITKQYLAGWAAIYETARPKTRNRNANTEVKFNRVVFNRRKDRAEYMAALAEVGIDAAMVILKPRTESISIHVF